MINNALLVILAHPDDESFGMGGTLAYYASRGFDVHLLCATKGEAGDVTKEKMVGYDSIADLRESELMCAAGNLGIKKVHFLDYRDSGMSGSSENHHPQALISQSVEDVSRKIIGFIRKIQPIAIITFDPIGGYRHPDHIAIHNATVKAFYLAGDDNYKFGGLDPFQPQKLFFHTFPRGFLRIAVKLLRLLGKVPGKFGRNGDIDLESFAYENFPIHIVINIRKFRKHKEKARCCHSSQGGGRMGGGVQSFILRLFDNKESFMQAYPVIDTRTAVTHDFFSND